MKLGQGLPIDDGYHSELDDEPVESSLFRLTWLFCTGLFGFGLSPSINPHTFCGLGRFDAKDDQDRTHVFFPFLRAQSCPKRGPERLGSVARKDCQRIHALGNWERPTLKATKIAIVSFFQSFANSLAHKVGRQGSDVWQATLAEVMEVHLQETKRNSGER